MTATNYTNSPCTTQEADLRVSICQNWVLPSTLSLWVSFSKPNCINAFLMVQKLATCSMDSFLPSSPFHLLLFLSPPLLLNTPKLSIQMKCLSMSNSGDRSCLQLNRSRADLPCIKIRRFETLIWNNLPHSDQSVCADTFSQKEWINKNGPNANQPLLFNLLIFLILSLFWLSARQQACSCVLHPWIKLSSVCVLFCEWLKMAGF